MERRVDLYETKCSLCNPIFACIILMFCCAPAAPSDHPPEFLNDIGKTLIELKNEHPEGELIVRPGGFPDNAAVCFGEPEAEFAHYFSERRAAMLKRS